MTNRSLYFAVLVAAIGVVFAVFTMQSGSVSPQDVRRMADRLDALEGWVQSLERRLDEYQLDDPDREEPFDEQEGDDSAADDAPDLAASPEDATGDGPVGSFQRIEARLRDLDVRVRGLEVDPVERGYGFLESDNASLRRDGVLLLKRVARHDRQAVEALRNMLQDPDSRVRMTTIDVLGDVKDREALPSIRELLADPESTVRREAIFGLLRLGGRDQGDAIAEMLDDPDGLVRAKAAYALGKLKYGESADLLMGALKDADERVRGEVIISLGALDDKKALPVLRDLYDNDPGTHRYRLVRTLKSLGDAQPFETEYSHLAGMVESEQSADARLEAIRALSRFARKEAKELFKKATKDPNGRVRNEARRALGWSYSSRRSRSR